ncbi:MAG: dienelactone hydrolase family protein [Pseudomonadota bacterium]|nr:dienelactone hydrolase family protein [Pseudomonadota bacterium]
MRFYSGVICGLVACVFVYVVATGLTLAGPQLGDKLASLSWLTSLQPNRNGATDPDTVQQDTPLNAQLVLQPMAQTVTAPNTFITRTRRMPWLLHQAQQHTQDYTPSSAVKAASQPGRTGAIHWQAFLPEGTTPAPLVILFAGAGRSPLSVVDMWLDTAQRHDVILVSPDTRDPQGFLSDLQHDTLQQMIAQISQTREVDPDQIYLFGHSQGGQVALTLANQINGPWCAVATHGGFPQASSIRDASAAPPLRLYLGDRDQIFSVTSAQEAGKRYARAGHRTELHLIAEHGHWFYDKGPRIAEDAWQWFQAQSDPDPA